MMRLQLCLLMLLVSRAAAQVPPGAAGFKPAPDRSVKLRRRTAPPRARSIGADGPSFTQVELAQLKLGLSGKGVRAGWIDTGVDFIDSDLFGKCTGVAQPADTCRVVVGYNGDEPGKLPLPDADLKFPGSVGGTFSTSIMAATFPDKLKDPSGAELQYQRGVAYGASVGIYKGLNAFEVYTDAPTKDRMDVLGMAAAFSAPVPDVPFFGSSFNTTMINVASAGVKDGAVLHRVGSPAAFDSRIAIAGVQNTATAGALIHVDTLVRISNAAGQPFLAYAIIAWLRIDTRKSLQNRFWGGDLPATIVAIDCSTLANATAVAQLDATLNAGRHIGLINCDPFPKSLAGPQGRNATLFRLLWKTVGVFVAAPKNRTQAEILPLQLPSVNVPVLWLTDDNGKALWAAQAAASARIRVNWIGGAPIPLVNAMQPSETSSWGPSASLNMKPDFAAPATLYSSLGWGAYGTLMLSTSGSTAYATGAIALWKEQRTKQVQDGTYKVPADGWTMAAKREFKLTARPLPWASGLMWPVARLGTGLIQVYNAIVNRVVVEPFELPLPSATASHDVTLTLSNEYAACDVTYNLKHLPAATISLGLPEFRFLQNTNNLPGMSASHPIASVSFSRSSVTVAKKSTAKVTATIQLPQEMMAAPFLYSGFITFDVQTTACPFVGDVRFNLTVPYQGSSKEFSSGVDVPMMYAGSNLPAELQGLDQKICVLAANFYRESSGYFDEATLEMRKPTCLPSPDGTWPEVVNVTLAEMKSSRLCLAVAMARPSPNAVLFISKRAANGTFSPLGTLSYGSASLYLGGPGIPCFTWAGSYTSTDGVRGTMPEDADAVYRIRLETSALIPEADKQRISKAEPASVTFSQLLRIVPAAPPAGP